MGKKINVLQINNIDLAGRRFNGYDLLTNIQEKDVVIKQIVVNKQSNNNNVVTFFNNYFQMDIFEKLIDFENEQLSIHSNLSLTSPALMNSQVYKDADILHFHMFHNTKLSLFSLLQICNEKKVILSIHDPWSITGKCVHFEECNKWKTGCKSCDNLSNLFEFKRDNCNNMWKLKKLVYKNINPHIVVSSQYMYDLLKQSPLTKHFSNIDIIPLGIDLNFFKNISSQKAKKRFGIDDDNIVIFLRAQNALKGTKYVVKALEKLDTNKKITILTCDEKGLLDEIKNKYKIIDLGVIKNEELLYAYNACDIFLMPSTGETFGMMAIEAMACEKPVIIFNNTALPDVTFAPECGVLVENKNSFKLMEAIKELIENSHERESRGKLGREICEKNYTIDKYNETLINLYKKIAITEQKKGNRIWSEKVNYNCIESQKIQNELNKFTKKISKENDSKFNDLLFNSIYTTDNQIDYSNIEVQKVINNYNNKLYDLLTNQIKKNNILMQIMNAFKLLIKDRKKLKNSIQYKIEKVFRKKD